MKKNLCELMKESESIIDLEDSLRESGREFSNYKEYIDWLGEQWDQISAEKINRVLRAGPKESDFPTLKVELDGIEYQLHGIIHGWPILLAPGWHLRKNVRDYISQKMGSFHNPTEREGYLYEEGADHLFDLFKSQELEDVKHTMKNSRSEFKNIGKLTLSIPTSIFATSIIPMLFGLAYLYSKTITNPKSSKTRGLLYLAQKALNDERYQSKLAEFSLAEEMPQPFNLEKEYLSDKGSFRETMIKSVRLKPDLATAEERSLWTSKELKTYANRKKIKRLHYLCGNGHATEIAYFLRHPNYSFERLEEYRQRKNK